ncbi:S-adenosylmethionine carrier 1, chloroplastic/mitochondrial-like protein isoform X2 [Tanacetum coccineum]
MKSWPGNFNALAHLTAGSVGGAASSIIRVPTEVVTQRMKQKHGPYTQVAYNDFVADGSLSAVREKGLGSKNDSGCVLSFKHRNMHSMAQTLCENACKRVRTVRQWIESNAQQAVIE